MTPPKSSSNVQQNVTSAKKNSRTLPHAPMGNAAPKNPTHDARRARRTNATKKVRDHDHFSGKSNNIILLFDYMGRSKIYEVSGLGFKNKGGDFGRAKNQVKTRLTRISAYIYKIS